MFYNSLSAILPGHGRKGKRKTPTPNPDLWPYDLSSTKPESFWVTCTSVFPNHQPVLEKSPWPRWWASAGCGGKHFHRHGESETTIAAPPYSGQRRSVGCFRGGGLVLYGIGCYGNSTSVGCYGNGWWCFVNLCWEDASVVVSRDKWYAADTNLFGREGRTRGNSREGRWGASSTINHTYSILILLTAKMA